MMSVLFLFGVLLPACFADNVPIVAPIRCAGVPETTFQCLKSPTLLPQAGLKKCNSINTECEKFKCAFNQLGWLKDEKLVKDKILTHLSQLSYKNPNWTLAVEKVKLECLKDLPAQGIWLNCPAYDVSHCFLVEFLKNAPASQWSEDIDCKYPRQYASACPICPEDCFAPTIPYGSCNACKQLPKTP